MCLKHCGVMNVNGMYAVQTMLCSNSSCPAYIGCTSSSSHAAIQLTMLELCGFILGCCGSHWPLREGSRSTELEVRVQLEGVQLSNALLAAVKSVPHGEGGHLCEPV
jgi:hypothetical protein